MLRLPAHDGGKYTGILLMVLAYATAVVSRLPLGWSAASNPDFVYEGRIIPIWTPDAGYIGAHAKRLLEGKPVPFDSEHMAGHLMAWISEATGAHIDTVMFYAPAFLGALIVIPVLSVFLLYRLPFAGFIAAVFSAIGFNFYYRTHLGYADTDMLNFFFVYTLLLSMIAVAERRRLREGWLGFAALVALGYWYHAYRPLASGLLAVYFFYILFFDRKNAAHYFAFALFLAALLPGGLAVKTAAALAVSAGWRFFAERAVSAGGGRLLPAVSVALFLAAVAYALLHPGYYYRIVQYLDKQREIVFSDANGTVYHVQGALKGISEAMGMPLSETVFYLSGGWGLFLVAVAGLVILARNRRSSVLLWSMPALALAGSVLGVRFTTFGVPVVGMGIAVVICALFTRIRRKAGTPAAFAAGVTAAGLLFWQPVASLIAYNGILRPVYLAPEVAMLDTLSKQGSEKDFIVSWWDEGWPLWYFTGKRTLVDNGKHGADNYLAAKMLFSDSDRQTAGLAAFFLSEYAKHYGRASVLKAVARTTDLKALLAKIASSPVTVRPDFDIYFFFHDSLIERLPAIASWAVTEETDALRNEILSYTYLAKPFSPGDRYVYAKGFEFDRRTGTVSTADGRRGKVGRLIISDGVSVRGQRFYPDADYNLVLYKNRYVLMLSDRMLNAFVIRGLLLNHFDPRRFETAGVSEHARAVKLKRD